MTPPEAELMLEKAKKLWPRWKPSKDEEQVWISRIEACEKSAAVSRALDEHYASSRWARPTLVTVMQAVRQFDPLPEGKDGQVDQGTTDVWLQCITAPLSKPGRLGWYVPIVWAKKSLVPERNRVMRYAERMRERYESMYGGQWVVVQEATRKDMEDSRAELRYQRKEKAE